MSDVRPGYEEFERTKLIVDHPHPLGLLASVTAIVFLFGIPVSWLFGYKFWQAGVALNVGMLGNELFHTVKQGRLRGCFRGK